MKENNPQTAGTAPVPESLTPKTNWPKRLILAGSAALVILVGVLAIRGPAQPPAPVKKDIAILKVGAFEGPLSGFYPSIQLTSGSIALNRQVFEGLVRHDQQAKIVPLLATTWTNPDESSWIFELKHDVKFHNGKVMTADDVKASLLAEDSNFVKNFGGTIKQVDVLEDHKVKITTDGPDPLLLNRLTLLYVFDSESAEKNNAANGTGPYHVKPGTSPTEQQAELVAFDNYHGGHIFTRELQFKVHATDAEMEAGLRKGDINTGFFLGNNNAAKLAAEGFHASDKPTTTVAYIGFNHKFKGAMQNLKVRQALYHAIDVPALQKAKDSTGSLASQIVPQAIPGFNPAIQRLDYNLAKSKQLLQEAGYPRGVTLKMAYFDEPEAVIVELEKQLAAAGFTMKRDPHSSSVIPDVVFDPTTEATFLSYSSDLLDLSDVVSVLFQGDLYSNPEVDRLMDESSRTIDSAKRLEMLQNISKLIMDDVGWVPLWVLHVGIVADQPYVIEPDAGAGTIYYWKAHLLE